MKREAPPQTLASKDLYLSAYLKAKNHPLHNATLDEKGRTLFHFTETASLSSALKDYYTGTALVSPLAYIEAFKALRSLAYSMSDKNMNGGMNYGKSARL